uniref:Uncharacterized protein n=1 Tax=Alexandrium catenella TaxID=2925 RepID=A0A7S1S1J7_ALECA
MLYRADRLPDLRKRLASVVWNSARPRCLDVDVALASISDEVAYYAVPAIQRPGFLSEGDQGSSRWDLNKRTTTTTRGPPTTTATTATSTTATTTTYTFADHFPAVPSSSSDREQQRPILVLGDGHYVVNVSSNPQLSGVTS